MRKISGAFFFEENLNQGTLFAKFHHPRGKLSTFGSANCISPWLAWGPTHGGSRSDGMCIR